MWEGCVTSFVVGKIKKTQARPSAAPHRGAARPCGCVFFDFPSVFEVFCRLSHNYQHPPGQGVSIIMAFRVLGYRGGGLTYLDLGIRVKSRLKCF